MRVEDVGSVSDHVGSGGGAYGGGGAIAGRAEGGGGIIRVNRHVDGGGILALETFMPRTQATGAFYRVSTL